ncbi:MAG: NADH-quinone oxidoreductase subunit C [Phycisphaerae bacterium]|nr:NADH-quinone oxidoreductase subunit C [Phycisphaerae bacterium]
MASEEAIIARLRERFSGVDFAPAPLLMRGLRPGPESYVRVPAARLLEVMRFLRDDPVCAFEQLCELTCVDYLNFPAATDRFGVTYLLLSISHGHRLTLKCFVNDPEPKVPSVTGLWPGADWMEREVFDMFGVRFEGHPDLRRILTWDDFEAHPLRKDYPLRGRGEREDYPVITRDSA